MTMIYVTNLLLSIQVAGEEAAETPAGQVPYSTQHPPVPHGLQGPPLWPDRWESSSQEEPARRRRCQHSAQGLHATTRR